MHRMPEGVCPLAYFVQPARYGYGVWVCMGWRQNLFAVVVQPYTDWPMAITPSGVQPNCPFARITRMQLLGMPLGLLGSKTINTSLVYFL